VDNLAPKFVLPASSWRSFAMRRYRLCSILVFIVFVGLLGGGSAAARVGAQNAPAASLSPGAPFAIADFDGDLLPDLISIQTGSDNLGSTNYWIQLRLSAAGKQSIQLVAPAGGLFIVARDVNGDHSIDLVLATAWSRKPVAIFLNDGRGNFSWVEPTAFPEAFSESTANLASHSIHLTDAFGVLTQLQSGACRKTSSRQHACLQSTSLLRWNAGFSLDTFLVSHEGRAPPVEVPSL
jgi:hypothetical protein